MPICEFKIKTQSEWWKPMEAQPCLRKGWEFIGHYKVSSTRRLQNFPLISGRSAEAGGRQSGVPLEEVTTRARREGSRT